MSNKCPTCSQSDTERSDPQGEARCGNLRAVTQVNSFRRLAHADWLRANKALHILLGIERFPGTGTVRNLFIRFRQGHIEAF